MWSPGSGSGARTVKASSPQVPPAVKRVEGEAIGGLCRQGLFQKQMFVLMNTDVSSGLDFAS